MTKQAFLVITHNNAFIELCKTGQEICQSTCKPDSVSNPAVKPDLRATIHLGEKLPFPSSNQPVPKAETAYADTYLVLLPMGFAVPVHY